MYPSIEQFVTSPQNSVPSYEIKYGLHYLQFVFSYEASVFGFVNARVGLLVCALEFTAPVVIADSKTSSEFTSQDVTLRAQRTKVFGRYRPEEVCWSLDTSTSGKIRQWSHILKIEVFEEVFPHYRNSLS